MLRWGLRWVIEDKTGKNPNRNNQKIFSLWNGSVYTFRQQMQCLSWVLGNCSKDENIWTTWTFICKDHIFTRQTQEVRKDVAVLVRCLEEHSTGQLWSLHPQNRPLNVSGLKLIGQLYIGILQWSSRFSQKMASLWNVWKVPEKWEAELSYLVVNSWQSWDLGGR